MRKSQTAKINVFLLLLFYIEKFTKNLLENIYLEKLSLYCYIRISFLLRVAGYWK